MRREASEVRPVRSLLTLSSAPPPCPSPRSSSSSSSFHCSYNGVLHIHTAAEECAVGKIISTIDAKTGKPRKERFMKSFKSGSVMIKLEQSICLEKFDNIPQMGRFTLRDEERTIAIGMVTGLPKSAVGGSSGRGGRASK